MSIGARADSHACRCPRPTLAQELPANEGLLLYISSQGVTHKGAGGFHMLARGQHGSAATNVVDEDVLCGSDLMFLRRTPLLIIADGALEEGAASLFVRRGGRLWLHGCSLSRSSRPCRCLLRRACARWPPMASC